MYCEKCGNKLNQDCQYCQVCGSTIEEKSNKFNKNNVEKKPTDTLPIILSIISILTIWSPIVSIPCAILGIINGKKYQKENNKKSSSIIISVTSIILSIIIILLLLIFLIYFTKEHIESDSLKKEINNIDNYFDDYYYDKYDTKESFDITGYSWNGDDSSTLYLNNDKSYNWYMNDNNHDDNFYSGTYEVYTGLEAINYIANNLKEYGITKQDQWELFDTNDYEVEDYYLLILNCTTTYIDGSLKEHAAGSIPYYGFYDDYKESLSLINMKTSNKAVFYLNSDKNILKDNNSI